MHASFIVRQEFGREEFEALRRYCRSLDVPYAGFAVLTPLPGTDYYEEVKDTLLTHDPAYFDFVHTVLPTKLPLKDFYRQYVRLITNAVSPARILSFFRQFPRRELPGALAKAYRFVGRVRAIHRDYATEPGPGAR